MREPTPDALQHNLNEYLEAYLDVVGIDGDKKGALFRTARGRTGELTDRPMSQADVYRMIARRAEMPACARK